MRWAIDEQAHASPTVRGSIRAVPVAPKLQLA
jgi:hypothetical protein